MDSTVLILAVLGAAMIAVVVLMAIGYSDLWMEDDSDDRFVAEVKRMLNEKLKNDQVEPEEDTYVSFEELLEKPKRKAKNDEKEKRDSLPFVVVQPVEGRHNAPFISTRTADDPLWDKENQRWEEDENPFQSAVRRYFNNYTTATRFNNEAFDEIFAEEKRRWKR
jgi:hypothetical protein